MEAGLGDATFFITFPCCLHNAFFPHRHEIGSPVHYIKARADLEAPIEVRMCVCVLCAYVFTYTHARTCVHTYMLRMHALTVVIHIHTQHTETKSRV
jgi:hypothetical protein